MAEPRQRIRLEDNYEDVLTKAATGLGIGNLELSEQAGVPPERIRSLFSGQLDEGDLVKVAGPLGLHGPSLLEMARGSWKPEEINVPGLYPFNTPFPVPGYEEMTVNSYLIKDPHSADAVVFDSGADATELLEFLRAESLCLRLILLTHAHGDHIKALDELVVASGNAPVWINGKEAIPDAKPFSSDHRFTLGSLDIETRLTDGHSAGGTTYLVSGLARPVAVVGDSLFCLSQGGARGAYHRALKNNRDMILSLSEETVLCPGHGPLTTVAWERMRNPFFPELK